LLISIWAFPCSVLAQTQDALISNREIAERLTRLEEGQKALAQRLEDVNTSLNKRLEDVNTSLNKRIDDLRTEMNQRFNDIMTLLRIIISTLVALVLAIAGAGFVIWRKILTVDAAVQIGLDQAVREQVLHLEQEMGFVKGKLKELSDTLGKG